MQLRRLPLRITTLVAAVAITLATVQVATAQVLQEDFEGVSETGIQSILIGAGFNIVDDWDTGLSGENAFAGTVGYLNVNPVSAVGSLTAGVDGGGGATLSVAGVNFNILEHHFNTVTGVGGGVFLAGDGVTPDTFNYTLNWEDAIYGEGAFAGTFGGAILVGDATAEGVPGGGVDSQGGARLDVDNVNLGATGGWYAGLQWGAGSLPGGTALVNPSFDDGGVASLTGWSEFGPGWNVLPETITPQSPPGICKMFGQFNGAVNESGIVQVLPASEGQTWELDVATRHNTGDSLVGTANIAIMRIEYLDAGSAVIGSVQATVLDAASPLNVWQDNTPISLAAPVGTAYVRPVIAFVQTANAGGAALYDDVSLTLVGGPPSIDLSAFSLTADIRGTVDVGGEVLGDYQLRIEDTDGDRLVFYGTANGSWQTGVGGALSTATEADSTGTPASGVFNVNSSSYTVVIAFDNDGANQWGTGGTLEVDNLVLTNSNSEGAGWYAGLFWDGLTTTQTDMSLLKLTADVKGDVVGGDYVLRLEAFKSGLAGLNEDFELATQTGGGLFLIPDDIPPGGSEAVIESAITNYDDGIDGEGAFGGVFGLAEFFDPSGGISAQVVSDGTQGFVAEIRVECISAPTTGGWFAGLTWGNQLLPSTDLGAMELTARIKGTSACFGGLGDYELRIEDAQGDRLYFPMTANGSWQDVGGFLNTATEGPRAGGGGDGSFNFDSASYTVVVAFVDPNVGWEFGGVLQVDELYLTPAVVNTQIGEVSFSGTADGTFQQIGGFLTEGVSNLGDTNQDFNSATGTGGGEFYTANGGGILGGYGWDDGIEFEQAFAGVWGDGTIANVYADACLTCGSSSTPAGRLEVESAAYGASGGWWAGLTFPGVRIDLSAGAGDNLAALSDVIFSAKIQGLADTGLGQTLGNYQFRIEDAETDYIAFNMTADGTLQPVGGALSTAVRGQTPDGNGSFNYVQGAYNITLVIEGGPGYDTWGSGGTLIIDDLFVTGVPFSSADNFTVTATFENEMETWGTGAALTVDNIYFGEEGVVGKGDMNCDGFVDIDDVEPFVQALTDPAGYIAAYPDCDILNGDVLEDTAVNGLDIAAFTTLLISN